MHFQGALHLCRALRHNNTLERLVLAYTPLRVQVIRGRAAGDEGKVSRRECAP